MNWNANAHNDNTLSACLFCLVLGIATCLTGCDRIRQRQQAGAAVELNGQVLYKEDLRQLTVGLDSVDSARVAEQFIRQWAVNILQYEKATGNRSAEIEAKVEDYRRSLYLYEYEQHLVARHMPKEVADSVVEQFYEQHKEQFRLNETILRGILIVFPNRSPKQDKLRQWLQHPDEENLEHIEKFAYQYATGYELFVNEWKTANQILLRLPIETDILQQKLNRQPLIEVSDSVSTYFLQVTDKRLAGDYMPVDYAKTEIERIVLAQRQVEFLQKERLKLYQDAIRHRKMTIYEK